MIAGADLNVMKNDAKEIRGDKPFIFVNCKTNQGVDEVAERIIHDVLFDSSPRVIN